MTNVTNCLKNYQDVEDFVRGVTFMGTGGGGSPKVGINRLLQLLNDNISIEWVKPSEIDDNVWTCSVFGMGSIAPTDPEAEPFGLKERVDLTPNVRAIKELEKIAGIKVEVIVPFELGGNNTCIAVNAAMKLGLKLPDGDYSGRAVPELSQVYPAIYNIPATPLAICDEWGHVIHVLESPNNISAEGIGKMVSTITKAPDMNALCAHAAFLLKGKEMKKYLIPNTLSNSLKLGRAIREARDKKENPIAVAVAETGGKILFKGKVIRKDFVSRDGYMFGDTIIEGINEFKNHKFRIWYKNENHLALFDEKVKAMSPDLIVVVNLDTAEPITNTDLVQGCNVGVIGIPNFPYRSEAAINMMCPKYFGFDYDYIPIEKLW